MRHTKWHRPEPILRHKARRVNPRESPERVADLLRDGAVLLLADHYSDGAEILHQLHRLMRPPPENAPHGLRQAFQRSYREAAMRLLAPIAGHRLALKGARHIGFLRELYPERDRFVLPFIQAQELHGAWIRYQKGFHFAVLGHAIHPFFGVYVPTRVSHLELFGTWLSQYKGVRRRAVDVGTGCGILAFMLCRAGFEGVLATDCNPNAIESVKREFKRLSSAPAIDLACGDLFANDVGASDLIVFNPPWIQGPVSDPFERALFFEDGLFQRFFDQAASRLEASGRIVLLFSNVMQLVQPDLPHPILAELEKGRFRLVQKLTRKVKPAKTKSGRLRKTREKVEVWELAKA